MKAQLQKVKMDRFIRALALHLTNYRKGLMHLNVITGKDIDPSGALEREFQMIWVDYAKDMKIAQTGFNLETLSNWKNLEELENMTFQELETIELELEVLI